MIYTQLIIHDIFFFFSSRRRHTRCLSDWSSDVCSSDLGANGAAQAILDCRALSEALLASADPIAALKAYEAKRLPATSEVVLANREAPPDAILHEVYRRTGDKPFKNIDDVISREELVALSESYKRVAGYDKERLKTRA